MILNSTNNKNKERLFEMFQKVNGVIITESVLSKEDKREIIKDFIKFCANKLDLKILPKIIISYDQNEASTNKSFGGYSPSNKSIRFVLTNRNLADGLRTLGHEIKHYEQDLKGLLNNKSGETGSEQENEANSFAGIVMREYGKLHPEIFE